MPLDLHLACQLQVVFAAAAATLSLWPGSSMAATFQQAQDTTARWAWFVTAPACSLHQVPTCLGCSAQLLGCIATCMLQQGITAVCVHMQAGFSCCIRWMLVCQQLELASFTHGLPPQAWQPVRLCKAALCCCHQTLNWHSLFVLHTGHTGHGLLPRTRTVHLWVAKMRLRIMR